MKIWVFAPKRKLWKQSLQNMFCYAKNSSALYNMSSFRNYSFISQVQLFFNNKNNVLFFARQKYSCKQSSKHQRHLDYLYHLFVLNSFLFITMIVCFFEHLIVELAFICLNFIKSSRVATWRHASSGQNNQFIASRCRGQTPNV